MDVGFSNQNYLGKIAPEFADVVFFVECDGSQDQFNLWQDWAKESSNNIPPLSEETITKLKSVLHGTGIGGQERLDLFEKINNLNNKVKYNHRTRYNWKDVSAGFSLVIGNVEIGGQKLPVNVSFSFAYIDGHKICFYYTCSRVNDSQMVEDWLKEHFQLTHDGYTRWNHVDANNFHNCVNSLDRLDKEPRNVTSIDLMTPRAIRTNWYPGCKFKQNAILTKILGDNPRFKAGLSKKWRFWDKDFENWIWAESLDDATANFRMLEWYEHREPEEMPPYIQDNFFPITIPESVNPNYRKIYKVKQHNVEEFGEPGCVVFLNGDDELFLPYNHCLPSTEDKFNEQ